MSRFLFERSFYEATKRLADGERLSAYDAILAYALDGEEQNIEGTAGAIFALVKPSIDKRRRDAARKRKARGR